MILALDISSAKTGICCMNEGKLYMYTYIDTQTNTKKKKEKFQDLYDKIEEVVAYFKNWDKLHPNAPKITSIHVEDPLAKVSSGLSSAHTLQVLFKMNFSLCYKLYEIFGIKPVWHNVRSATKTAGLTVPRKSDRKKLVFDYVTQKFPDFLGGQGVSGNLPKSSPFYDITDSIIIAMCAEKLILDGNEHSNENDN